MTKSAASKGQPELEKSALGDNLGGKEGSTPGAFTHNSTDYNAVAADKSNIAVADKAGKQVRTLNFLDPKRPTNASADADNNVVAADTSNVAVEDSNNVVVAPRAGEDVAGDLMPLPVSLARGQNLPTAVTTPGAFSGGAPGEGLVRNDAAALTVPADGAGPPPLPAVASNGGLVEANLVEEDEASDLEAARPIDPEFQQRKDNDRKKTKFLFGGLLVLTCLVVVVAVAILLRGTNQTNISANTVAPTPSLARPLPPMKNLEELFWDLPEGTRVRLHDSDTPQQMAWNWLLTHRNITHLEEWRKKQIYAMATFYFSMDGPKWPESARKDWLNDSIDECSWISTDVFYVSTLAGLYLKTTTYDFNPCNSAGEIRSIFLIALQLQTAQPRVPEEISLLTSLQVLGLLASGINALVSNIISPGVLQLPNLELLVLQNNELHGKIPASIGQMTALKHLLVGNNQLTGKLPSQMAEMAELKLLILDRNELSGQLPSQLGQMTQMTDLTLSQNFLTGSLPSELANLGNTLKELSIYENFFEGNIPTEFGLLSNLKICTLQGNSLTGTVPVELAKMTSITQLHLNTNQLTGQLPTQVGLMTKLEGLTVSEMDLSGSIPSQLGMLTSNMALLLGENLFSGSIPSTLGALTKLTLLGLEGNFLSGVLPTELSLLTNLKRVDLSNLTLLSGTIPEELCHLGSSNSSSCLDDNVHDLTHSAVPCSLDYDCSDILCGCGCKCLDSS